MTMNLAQARDLLTVPQAEPGALDAVLELVTAAVNAGLQVAPHPSIARCVVIAVSGRAYGVTLAVPARPRTAEEARAGEVQQTGLARLFAFDAVTNAPVDPETVWGAVLDAAAKAAPPAPPAPVKLGHALTSLAEPTHSERQTALLEEIRDRLAFLCGEREAKP